MPGDPRIKTDKTHSSRGILPRLFLKKDRKMNQDGLKETN